MLPDPLHPAVVHFPIVLASLLPVLGIVALVALQRDAALRSAWLPVVVLALLAFATAFAAKQTGENEEDRVEEVVSHDVIHEHEEAGERAVIALGIVLAIGAGGLLDNRLGRIARPLSVVAMLAAVVFVGLVGRSGGELVYEHGAAAAYTSPVAPADED